MSDFGTPDVDYGPVWVEPIEALAEPARVFDAMALENIRLRAQIEEMHQMMASARNLCTRGCLLARPSTEGTEHQ